MKFTFIGDKRYKVSNPKAGFQEHITMGGIRFPLDEPVEVDNPDMIKKLSSNSHFEMQASDERATESRKEVEIKNSPTPVAVKSNGTVEEDPTPPKKKRRRKKKADA